MTWAKNNLYTKTYSGQTPHVWGLFLVKFRGASCDPKFNCGPPNLPFFGGGENIVFVVHVIQRGV